MKQIILTAFLIALTFIACNSVKNEYSTDKNRKIESLIIKATSGDSAAQFSLGFKYYFGDQLKQNKDSAKYWLGKAAEAGHEKAKSTYEAFFVIIPELENSDTIK